MALTLVLGPANSAKAGEVLGAFSAAAHRGALLVVPTAADADHYARELAQQGALLGSVLTFSALTAEIAARTAYAGRPISELQRERLVRRAVAATRFQALGDAAQTPGFAAAAGRLIAELERSLVTPQRFSAAMQAWAGQDERRSPYAQDVAAIYLGYARELGRIGREDRELHAWHALDRLRTAPGRWGTEPVFFYGFDDLHPLERDAVETLARIVGVEVTVSLTYEAGRAALGARAETVEELRPLAQRVIELPGVDDYYASSSRVALHHLERALFEGSPDRREPGNAVRLLEAGGERAEAELIAAEVLALLRAGVPGEEVVVVHRSLERAAATIVDVLRGYGIAVAIDHEVPFGHTTLGRGLLALARCALVGEDETRAEDLLAYLRSPGVLERPELADRLEAQVRREALRTAAQARERLGFELSELDALRSARDPAVELARQGRRLLAAPYRGSASILSPAEELDARALGTMLAAFAQLDELGEQLDGAGLLDLLGELRVPATTPGHPGAVLVSEPLAIRARRFRAVFVAGLQEGEFPRAAVPEPFLSDERRRELAAASGLRLRPVDDGLARERHLFYACVSRATEAVVLSYASSDEEGNLALPSPFIADVADLLVPEWSERRRKRLLADVVWPLEEAPTARELARSRAAQGAPAAGELDPPERSLSMQALAHVRHRDVVSGGALESYAACPVKWLVERELQPARFGPDPDPLARGSLMHSALEQILVRLGRAITAESLPDALDLVDDVLAELPPALAAGRAAGVREAAVRAIAADLRRYLAHEAADGCEWSPRALELRFGFEDEEEGSLPALELVEGPQRLRVRGMIDRVDVDPAGRRAVVRDYKSGSARPEHQGARWSVDRQLQVALYMLAVRDLMGLEPVAGLYQPLGGQDLRPRGVFLKDALPAERLVGTDCRDEEALQSELQDVSGRAMALAARLRAGELTPCPQTCSRDGCMYPGICRSQ